MPTLTISPNATTPAQTYNRKRLKERLALAEELSRRDCMKGYRNSMALVINELQSRIEE